MSAYDSEMPIQGNVIYRALDGVIRVGRAYRDLIDDEFESYGVMLDAKNRYSLVQIEAAFAKIFDSLTAQMLTARLAKELRAIDDATRENV